MAYSPNRVASWSVCLLLGAASGTHAILAGGQFSLPSDSPSNRLDTDGAYSFTSALEISAGGYLYRGPATALSQHWVLTAGHNVDFNDDGQVDGGIGVNFHLPGHATYVASSFTIHPNFTGFGNPSIQHDLSLLYYADPLPDLLFPTLGNSLSSGDTATLVGFGRSGYGSYGYTTSASLTDRRFGFNVIDELDNGLFRYDFDDPNTGDGLGNDIEIINGPGDSGGALLVDGALVGINTFTEGYDGLFGDFGGGIAPNDAWGWIHETTGLAIPEPTSALLLLIGSGSLVFHRRAKYR